MFIDCAECRSLKPKNHGLSDRNGQGKAESLLGVALDMLARPHERHRR